MTFAPQAQVSILGPKRMAKQDLEASSSPAALCRWLLHQAVVHMESRQI